MSTTTTPVVAHDATTTAGASTVQRGNIRAWRAVQAQALADKYERMGRAQSARAHAYDREAEAHRRRAADYYRAHAHGVDDSLPARSLS